jgi:diacylglycerol O-acyltransferase
MKHLSSLDATFLHLESPEMPMHVGSLNVLDLPEGYGGDFFEHAKAHLQSRMHLADVFTRKLALMPFDLANPVWVEDEDIDIDYHVRHITLPSPGSNRQLQQYVARLHSSLLDRSRPLWEFFFIDGLKSGQVAMYSKVHHAGIDGQAGVELGRAIFDLEPTGRRIKPPRARPRRNQYQLGIAELLGAAASNTVQQVVKLVKTIPTLAGAARSMLIPDKDEHGRRNWVLPRGFKLFAPRTSLNVAITNQRTFAGRTVPLAEVKQIAKLLGVSLNDVVMATVAGGLRQYLQFNDELPEQPLRAAVPVSLRAAGDATANNQVSMVVINLATDIADPLQRLRKIHESSDNSKAMMGRVRAAIPTDFPMLAAPWLMSGLASMYGRSRLANVLPPIANVAISNVAGIQAPMYFAGAKVVSYYPVSLPAHGVALNVTVQSYNGRLDYGLIACRRALPEVNELADMLLAEHRLLHDLALSHAVAEARPAEAAPRADEVRDGAARPAHKRAPKKTLARAPSAAVRARAVAKPPVKAPARKRGSRVQARA